MKTNSRILYELEYAGFNIDDGKFPYIYHHDYIKYGDMTRYDVAQRLRAVCEHLNQYDASACYGAIMSLVAEQPEAITSVICDTVTYVKERSVYNTLSCGRVCGRDAMRSVIKISPETFKVSEHNLYMP